MQILNIEKGSKSDTLYLQFNHHPIAHSFELEPDIIIDLDRDNAVVGIDVQHVAAFVARSVSSLPEAHAPMKLQLVAA